MFNSIQDMKGKIRVFCRVRPMLDFEEARGQSLAISIPDEFTASHFWKDDKKAREYQFDQVRNFLVPCSAQAFVGPPEGTVNSTTYIHRAHRCLMLNNRKKQCFRRPSIWCSLRVMGTTCASLHTGRQVLGKLSPYMDQRATQA